MLILYNIGLLIFCISSAFVSGISFVWIFNLLLDTALLFNPTPIFKKIRIYFYSFLKSPTLLFINHCVGNNISVIIK